MSYYGLIVAVLNVLFENASNLDRLVVLIGYCTNLVNNAIVKMEPMQ